MPEQSTREYLEAPVELVGTLPAICWTFLSGPRAAQFSTHTPIEGNEHALHAVLHAVRIVGACIYTDIHTTFVCHRHNSFQAPGQLVQRSMSCMSCNRCSECGFLCVRSCELRLFFLSFLHVHSLVPLHCSPDLFRCFLFMPQREWLRGIKLVSSPDQEADGGSGGVHCCMLTP